MPGSAELTAEQREAVESRGAAGGVVAYLRRLTDGHSFTFYEQSDGSLGVGVCTCGESLCHKPYIAVYRADMVAAYEAKIGDLQRETELTSKLAAALHRLYDGYSSAAKAAGFSTGEIRRFYRDGFPPDERDVLLAALADVEREWVLADDAS